MRNPATPKQTMLIAGLIQGFIMLGLHEWFHAKGFAPFDLLWAALFYALTVLAPASFNSLRAEFPVSKSIGGAAFIAIAFAASWVGWAAVPANEPDLGRGAWSGDLFAFGFVILTIWFIALPFIQSRLRHGNFSFPYPGLFADAWRNWLLVVNCFVFTGIFWLLLALWAGLYSVMNISFFSEIFTTTFFFYLVTAMAVSFAVSLEEREASALTTLRRYLLAFQTRLLPLASLIVVLFLFALPLTGVKSYGIPDTPPS